MGVLFFMIEGVIVIVIQTSDMIWILVPRIKHPEPLQALVLEEYKDWKANHENKEKIWKGKKIKDITNISLFLGAILQKSFTKITKATPKAEIKKSKICWGTCILK